MRCERGARQGPELALQLRYMDHATRKGVRHVISRENVQVFGNVPKEVKRRIKQITQHQREWSESKLIRAGLLRILSEIEGKGSPNHDRPRRKSRAA